jgi:dihydroflavonol-4-reductase
MNLSGANIAVTGATGFLGRYIADTLLHRGAHVIGVVRDPGKAKDLAQKGVELRTADLGDRAALARAFTGASAVVSNAALVSLGTASREDFQRTNIEGTRNVYDAMGQAGVKRVVQVSSAAVYRRILGHTVSEDHPLVDAGSTARMSAYAVSKLCAENVGRELAAKYDIGVSIVRPFAIYGAFDKTSFTKWFRKLMALGVAAPYPVGLRIALVYAGDVAESIALMLENPISISKVYNITGDDFTCWDFAREWKNAGGQTPFLMIPIPVPLAHRFDNSRAKRELGWRTRPYVEGCRELLQIERASS